MPAFETVSIEKLWSDGENYQEYSGLSENQQEALLFHQNTRLGLAVSRLPHTLTAEDYVIAKKHYKTYEGAPRLALPRQFDLGQTSLAQSLVERRSTRDYSGEPISLSELSQLLYAAGGITGQPDPKSPFISRTNPSGGSLYPLEIYAAVMRAEDFEPGLYHYGVKEHFLELLEGGDISRAALNTCAAFAGHVKDAAVIFFITGVFDRMLSKYGPRGYRYILIEAGHIGQNIYLAATALGIGTLALGSFVETKIEQLLNIDGIEESPVYVLAVGRKK